MRWRMPELASTVSGSVSSEASSEELADDAPLSKAGGAQAGGGGAARRKLASAEKPRFSVHRPDDGGADGERIAGPEASVRLGGGEGAEVPVEARRHKVAHGDDQGVVDAPAHDEGGRERLHRVQAGGEGEHRHDGPQWQRDHRAQVAQRRVEVAERLHRAEPREQPRRLRVQEDLEAAAAPARALLEDLPQVLRRLPRHGGGGMVAHDVAGGAQLHREQEVLGDRLGGEPAHLGDGRAARHEVGAAADGRLPRVEPRLDRVEEAAVVVVEDVRRGHHVVKVLRRLHERGARLRVQVRQRLLEEVGVRLLVAVEHHQHRIRRGALRVEHVAQRVVEVARLAVVRLALGPRDVPRVRQRREPREPLRPARLGTIVKQPDSHPRGERVAQGKRRAHRAEDEVVGLGAARDQHRDVERALKGVCAWRVVAQGQVTVGVRGRRERLLRRPRPAEADNAEQQHAARAVDLTGAHKGLVCAYARLEARPRRATLSLGRSRSLARRQAKCKRWLAVAAGCPRRQRALRAAGYCLRLLPAGAPSAKPCLPRSATLGR
eukprot:scaffold54475_cov69-Phaeocystis_antarctica.AAC.6